MTQNNEAFEKWWHSSKYMQVVFSDNRTKRVALDGYEAATQARDSEINSLKQRVEELDAKLDAMTDSNNLNHRLASEWADKLSELRADNLRLREALKYLDEAFDSEMWNCERCGHGEETKTMDSAIYLKEFLATLSTPAQSLAEHDNEVIERCKNIVANDALAITFQSMGAYRSAIIKQIGELKAEHD